MTKASKGRQPRITGVSGVQLPTTRLTDEELLCCSIDLILGRLHSSQRAD